MDSHTASSKLQTLANTHTEPPFQLPASLANIVTPLILKTWEAELASHPNPQFRDFILQGIQKGFRIGFEARNIQLKSCTANKKSAQDHPIVVQDYLAHEEAAGRIGSLAAYPHLAEKCHISPFGVIPKKAKPGKWRLILDLSSPPGHSVNDGIDRELCSLSYTSVDEVADSTLQIGRGTLLAKVDIRQAYRNVPVHPDDRYLLGMTWRQEVFIDKVLPFGLRSAPLTFSAVADALQWIIQQKGVCQLFHYLDDFITLGPPNSEICKHNLTTILDTCEALGVPMETDKTVGLSPQIVFLGMELDSNTFTIRLPEDKLVVLRNLLREWSGHKAVGKRELLSLIGYLQHAAKAVRQGRFFLRRLIDLSTVTRHLEGFIRLNLAARSDIMWWRLFADQWNGTSMLYRYNKANPQIHVFSDASGSWGCGAYSGNTWFQFQWPADMGDCHISTKEMIPVVMAAIVWGHRWQGLSVCFHTDNTAVIALINQGSARDSSLMHLMRCLSFVSAKFNFIFSSLPY